MTTELRDPPPTLEDHPTRVRRRRWVALVALVAILALGIGVRAWWAGRPVDVRDGTEVVTADGMAARHGISVNLIAVTAAGGLVELRYQVVDPDKAAPILHDPALAPVLVAEDSGRTLVMAAPPHRHGGDLKLGATYFFLIANAHNALRPGEQVTLVIGDARLEHVMVEG
jgi:hypothetical protein